MGATACFVTGWHLVLMAPGASWWCLQEGKLGDMKHMLRILSDMGRTDNPYFKQQVGAPAFTGLALLELQPRVDENKH